MLIVREFDIYYNENTGRSFIGGFDGFEESDEVVFLCSATPDEIDDEIYKRERVNCEHRFAFENLGIDRLDEILNMFQNSEKLFRAVSLGNEILLEVLLSSGADPNYQDEDGKTPLMIAAKNGYASRFGVVEILVNAGAALGIEDKNGLTALDYANEVASEESWRPYIADFLKEKMGDKTGLCEQIQAADNLKIQRNDEGKSRASGSFERM